ncbi:hypothetical protein [Actinomadura flavalba]|uniref:hypothetical protein n=1 Tax=Actinomadura flavalba TaxID=1120938 RepID=UPI000365D702|nr:hypothetical protein [Actinomadura flavalba]
MPEKRPVAGTRYGDLVWLAYLVLPAEGRRTYRIALARRIADAAVTGRRRSPHVRRTRVLRRALRPPRRLRAGLGPWLRALPLPLPEPEVSALLAALAPHVRVAYVLERLAGLPPFEVRDQLTALGVRDPQAVMEEAARVPDPPSWPAPFPPGRARPVRTRSMIPLAAGVALLATLAGALLAGEGGPGGERSASAGGLTLVSAAPDAWRHGHRTLDAWPARGELTGDRALTRRALAAFAATGAGKGEVRLLYAGRLDEVPVVVLRRGGRIARYADPAGVADIATGGTDRDAPVAVGSGRYLLAPWDTRATLSSGRAVPLRFGVTAPVVPPTRCGRGPLFELHGPDGVRTVGELGGPRPVRLTYRTGGRPGDRLDAAGIARWQRLGCLLPRPARPVTAAAAWSFWSGELPHGGGRADWSCTRLTFTGGGTTAQAALLAPHGDQPTGWCDDRRPVAGTWWQAPSRRWYHLSAAAPGFVPDAEGAPRERTRDGRLLVARGPAGGARPETRVAISARMG